MISGDDLYGWGVFDIPIQREPRSGGSSASRRKCGAEPVRKLLHDIPWKEGGSSVLLTLFCLFGILFLNRNSPKPLIPTEPPRVEVAVRIFEEVPEIPAPTLAELQAPLPEERAAAVIREAPPPVPEEVRPAGKVPPPPPPEPVRTVRVAPARPPEPIRVQPSPNIQLPPPSLKSIPTGPPRRERPALPQEKAQVAARREAAETVVPEPSRSSHEERANPPSASLPKRTAALRNETASADLGEVPQRARAAERGTDADVLPEAPAIALDRSDGADPGGAAPRVNARYENLPDSPVPPPVPRRSVAQAGGGEAGILLPKATSFAPAGSRKTTIATIPPDGSTETSFAGAGRKPEPDLTGAAVRTASLPRAGGVPAAPGKSFEFLDLMQPADLDRSVMVSLNRLRTCLDPNEELTLKARLAAMLSGPGQCRSGGVVFDIRHPESAYSVHIDLYNYEQREFQDRCSALRLAVYSCEARR